MAKIPSSEITPQAIYLNRRAFMKASAAAIGVGATVRAAFGPAAAQ
jgi:hypothetical protein